MCYIVESIDHRYRLDRCEIELQISTPTLSPHAQNKYNMEIHLCTWLLVMEYSTTYSYTSKDKGILNNSKLHIKTLYICPIHLAPIGISHVLEDSCINVECHF